MRSPLPEAGLSGITLEMWIEASRSTTPPAMPACGFGLVWRLTMLTLETTTLSPGEQVETMAATEETTADETTADETTTDESTEDATMDDATTEDATTGEPALPIDPCTTPYPDPVLRAESLPDQTRDRAEEVLAAAADCDLDTLVALAQQDQTFLSFGVVSPEEAFAGEEGAERAAAIATVMTLFEPGQDAADAPYRWPGTIQSEEDWVLVVESGLHTQDEVDLMRGSGMGYTGWRVGVDSGGTWMFMTAGD